MTCSSTPTSTIEKAGAVGYGILCHALFVVGVGSMMAAMAFGMSRSLGRVPEPWCWPANTLLLVQFPLVHSLLLTPLGGRILRKLAPGRIGSRLATTTYAAIASAQVLLLFAFWTPSGTVWWRAEGPVLCLALAFYVIAWMLLLKAITDAGIAVQVGSLGWWAVANGRNPQYPPMPTTGLFRLTRQPIYVAFALTVWTVPTWTPDQLAVALTLTGYCILGPLLKERRFRRRFGDAFNGYARRVPYWLPWPRPARSVERND